MLTLRSSAKSLAQTSALELMVEGQPVRVNAIAPGFIRTNILPKYARELKSEYIGDPSGGCIPTNMIN